MTTYSISDILGTKDAILLSFGSQVFEHVQEHLEKDEQVTLSFKGINAVNLPFLSGLLSATYSHFPNKASDLLLFTDIENSDWQEDLNEAIYLAAHPEEARSWSSSLQH